MVKQGNLKNVREIIEENPGKTFTELFKIIEEKNLMARKTFSDALKRLRSDGSILRDDRKKHFINTGETLADDLKKTPNLLTITPISENRIIDIITRLYFFNELNKVEQDADIKNICRNFIKNMDKKFDNTNFEIVMEKLYNSEIISKVKSNLNKIKASYMEEYDFFLENPSDSFEMLYFIERSIQDQIKIFLRTRQKLYFSDNTIELLNAKVFDLFYEIFILNNEFMLTIKDIEDFKVHIEIMYDPNSDPFFNLNFFSGATTQIEELKDLILEYNNFEKPDESKIINKAIDDSSRRFKRLEEIEIYRKKFRSEVFKNLNLKESTVFKDVNTKKSIVAEYFTFKEDIRAFSSSLNLNDIYKKTMERYNLNMSQKKGERIFIQNLRDEVIKLRSKFFDKELQVLEEEENYPMLLTKIDEYLKKTHISKENKINLLLQKCKILANKYYEYSEALEVINEGFTLDNQEIDLYLMKAIIHHNNGDSIEGLKTLDYAFNVEKTNPRLFFQKSYILEDIGEIDKAINVISEGINSNKENSSGLKLLLEFKAWLYQTTKDYKNVLDTYDDLIRLFPKNMEYYQEKYNLLDDLQDYDKALETLDNFYKKFGPVDVGYYVNKSRILCDKNAKFNQALKTVNDGLKHFSGELNLYINKAIILNNMGEYEHSLKTLEEAEELDESNKFDVELLGRKSYILTNYKKFDEALEVSKRLIRYEPNCSSIILNHVDILKKVDRGKEGIPILENAVQIVPNDQNLIFEFVNLCWEYEKISPLRNTLKIINNALKNEPINIDLIMNKASLLYHLDKKDDALYNLEEAEALVDPNDEELAVILGLKSIIFEENGEIQRALEINKKALTLFPDHYPSYLQRIKYLKSLNSETS